jgi:nanoRNase/pAp phosphatase (c-di-AMP/oligoRNAs hydrolase)
MDLIDYCRTHGIDDILKLPDVVERVELYFDHAAKAKQQLQFCTTVHHNVAVLDLRQEDTIYAVNRFMIYALFPATNISIHVLWGVQKQNTVFAVGKSITNRTSPVNIGALMLAYGGGGHENAGTCQIDNDAAPQVLQELIAKINAMG